MKYTLKHKRPQIKLTFSLEETEELILALEHLHYCADCNPEYRKILDETLTELDEAHVELTGI